MERRYHLIKRICIGKERGNYTEKWSTCWANQFICVYMSWCLLDYGNLFYFYLAPVGVMEILAVLVSLMISNILFIPTVIIPSRWKTPYNVPDSYNCQNPFYVHGMLNEKKESKYALPIRKNGKLKSFLFLRKIMILWLGSVFYISGDAVFKSRYK